jgi:hypothetical protein
MRAGADINVIRWCDWIAAMKIGMVEIMCVRRRLPSEAAGLQMRSCCCYFVKRTKVNVAFMCWKIAACCLAVHDAQDVKVKGGVKEGPPITWHRNMCSV